MGGPWLRHDVTENALAIACSMPQLQASVNRTYQATFLSDKSESYGPVHDVLSMDCLMRQHGIEFAVEASRWKELFDGVVDLITRLDLHVHFPVEVRFVDEESSWIAPNGGRKTAYVGIVMYKPKGRNPPDWPKYFQAFESLASSLGGRPHWAKTFTWDHAQFVKAYPCFRAFCKLAEVMDPTGI